MNKKKLEELREEYIDYLQFASSKNKDIKPISVGDMIALIDALLEEEPCTRKCCREK